MSDLFLFWTLLVAVSFQSFTLHMLVCISVLLTGSIHVVWSHFLSRSAYILFMYQACTHFLAQKLNREQFVSETSILNICSKISTVTVKRTSKFMFKGWVQFISPHLTLFFSAHLLNLNLMQPSIPDIQSVHIPYCHMQTYSLGD